MNSLPIKAVLPDLLQVLTEKNAVLVAPPGAGKTTGVPLALLQEPWLQDKKIYLLEPRRVAARRAAYYLADCLGEKVGQTVGYRMRRDSKIGKETRLEVITEGILTRMLQQDESLSGCGIVIFDEFHERNIHADLGLALCLESQKYLREDLRLLVMSATLTAEPVAALLGNCPILVSEGKAFQVRTVYLTKRQTEPLASAVAKAVERALCEENGDVLVFLPGVREIREAQEKLQHVDPKLYVAPLYGALPQAEQDAAIHPAAGGARKVILATSIAETSLTVEGVRVVIDAGLMRIPQFSASRALTRLTTVRVTQDAADQRRGRAGRLAPGVCYRLWTMEEQNHLLATKPAEILESDLTFLVLELALWGVKDAAQLSWLDQPPTTAYEQAIRLLQELGALDEKRKITDVGRRLAEIGTEPRLARMILVAHQDGYGQTACRLAALLNERESLWKGVEPERTDIRRQFDALRYGGDFVNSAVRRRILNEADFLARALTRRSPASGRDETSESCGYLLALAYPDRIAQRRNDGRFLLRSGRGASVAKNEAELKQSDYLAVAELDDRGVDAKILLAAPLTAAEIEKLFAEKFSIVKEVKWDRTAQAVRAKKYQKLGVFIIKEQVDAEPDAELVTKTLIEGIKQEGLDSLPWSKEACQFIRRLQFLRYHQGDSWPDGSTENLLATLGAWLGPYLSGMTAIGDLQRLNLRQILADQLNWQQKRELDQLAPSYWTAPSGQKIMIDYEKPESPSVAVKLQAVFGLAATPCILAGKVPLTLALLSPAQRPVQVTQDLANFWRNTYFEVKKELMGRYPKHYWPEDPETAVPTGRVRPGAAGKAKENGGKKH